MADWRLSSAICLFYDSSSVSSRARCRGAKSPGATVVQVHPAVEKMFHLTVSTNHMLAQLDSFKNVSPMELMLSLH